MRSIAGYEAPLVPPPSDYSGNFFKGVWGNVFYGIVGIVTTQGLRTLTTSS